MIQIRKFQIGVFYPCLTQNMSHATTDTANNFCFHNSYLTQYNWVPCSLSVNFSHMLARINKYILQRVQNSQNCHCNLGHLISQCCMYNAPSMKLVNVDFSSGEECLSFWFLLDNPLPVVLQTSCIRLNKTQVTLVTNVSFVSSRVVE